MSAQDDLAQFDANRLLEARDRVLAKTMHALALLQEAMKDGQEQGVSIGWDKTLNLASSYQNLTHVEPVLRVRMDGAGWRRMLDASGMWDLLPEIQKVHWKERFRTYRAGPLDAESIAATLNELHGQKQAMDDDRFQSLCRSCTWDRNANQPVLLGRKVVWERLFEANGRLSHYSVEPLGYLQRMLFRLDGKPERGSTKTILDAVADAETKREWEAATEYVRLKWFRNGNAHLVFTRLDLVEKFNQRILQRYPEALPVPKGSAFPVGKVGGRAAG